MIQLIKSNDSYMTTDMEIYMIESPADVADLPLAKKTTGAEIKNDNNRYCNPGSFAYTADLQHVYQLGLDNVWHEI